MTLIVATNTNVPGVAYTLADGDSLRADSNQAMDATDRFIFRNSDKTLWFDANGTGSGGPVMVADLQSGATLVRTDIVIYADGL
jgi:hypothetical protein